MRISSALLTLVLAGLVGGAVLSPPAGSTDKKPVTAPSTGASEAVNAGLQLFRTGDYAAAVRALEAPARENSFVAQFTLAQIYADNAGTETDHPKAYMLYQSIADEYSDVDPDDAKRAPAVAKALTALAGYLLTGLPQIGVEPDAERAADYLHHAALFFGNEDAQFELVKLKLKGDGVPADIASAKHWLAVLTQRGHAGAQAFLADLYWRGKIMTKDPVRALALISVALENAPPRERIWIEDVYQNVFCGTGEGVRTQATGIVAEWRTRYGRKPEIVDRSGPTMLDGHATRTCQNGERVGPLPLATSLQASPKTPPAATTGSIPGSVPGAEFETKTGNATGMTTSPAAPAQPLPTPLSSQATAANDGLRDVGVTR